MTTSNEAKFDEAVNLLARTVVATFKLIATEGNNDINNVESTVAWEQASTSFTPVLKTLFDTYGVDLSQIDVTLRT